jgi:flagellar motility protein MotE (MotC chaperone)
MFRSIKTVLLLTAVSATLLLSGCSTAYYAAMEKVGVHKRDILIDRVEEARDAQAVSQQEFKDALDQLSQLINFHGGNVQDKYEALQAQYEDSKKAADEVTARINKVELVAFDLFDEWEAELSQYQNKKLKTDSKKKLLDTKRQFDALVKVMRRAESKMPPVLRVLNDNVLYLKHNLNAKAVGAIQGEFGVLQQDVNNLLAEMNRAIADSNQFIATMNQN